MKIRNPKYPFKQCGPWENCPICFEDFSLTPCTNCGNGFEDEYIEVPSKLEQLTARVRELEEENARLHEQVDLQIPAIAFKQLTEQLAASQAYAEQLREALETLNKVSNIGCDRVEKALALPRDGPRQLSDLCEVRRDGRRL